MNIEGVIEDFQVIPPVIAGPCSAETEEQVLRTAHELSEMGIHIFRAGIWKPRTKPGGFEGVGVTGLKWLERVRKETGMRTIVEVATPAHVDAALSSGVDMLWIGARTSSGPFAMQEIADELKRLGADVPVLVKNPVSADLELWIGALERLYEAGINRLGAIHRGFATYNDHIYRNHPQWRIPMDLRLRYPRLPIFCDPSHIAGRRDLIYPISQHAVDIGFDGLIIETHCCPDNAWSDAAQQITPRQLKDLLGKLIWRVVPVNQEDLMFLRNQIDQLDSELLEILSRRMDVARQIGKYKHEKNMPIIQPDRFDLLSKRLIAEGEKMGMSEHFLKSILSAVHEESVRQQLTSLK